MDSWLSQVAAMDAVISIANTTVHGSGGCGTPTLCLVSQQSDCWIEPDTIKAVTGTIRLMQGTNL